MEVFGSHISIYLICAVFSCLFAAFYGLFFRSRVFGTIINRQLAAEKISSYGKNSDNPMFTLLLLPLNLIAMLVIVFLV